MYLAFSSITGESTIPRMTRSGQMEEEILIVDLNFPETAFYIVIVLVILSPKTFNTLSLIYFYCHWVFGLAHRRSKPSGRWDWGSGILCLVKQHHII